MRLYDVGVATLWPYRQLVDQMVSIATANASVDTRVLELGCGTGNVLARYLEVRRELGATEFNMLGVDGNAAALDRAKMKFEHAGAKFLLEDLNNEKWTAKVGGGWDVVFCSNVLYNLENPTGFLRQVATVMARGGVFILTSPHTATPERVFAAHDAWVKMQDADTQALESERRAVRDRVIAWNERIVREGQSGACHFIAPNDLASMFREAGFVVLDADPRAYEGVNTLIVGRCG